MLDIYPVSLEVARLCGPIVTRIAEHDPDLARQLRRAVTSVPLNVAEGCGVYGGNRRLRFGTALGSVREVRAALDVAEALGYCERHSKLDASVHHVTAVLVKLVR